jgi:starch phosphorylase
MNITPAINSAALQQHGDHYRHLADLASYAQAHQRLGELYAAQPAWKRKVILNLAAYGRFSSDHTIAEYAREIWHAEPCLTE